MENVKTTDKNAQSRDDEPAIPVHKIWLCVGSRDPDFPLSSKRGGYGWIETDPKLGIEIHLLPRRQEYRVVEKSRDQRLPDTVFYIPKTWAAWQPMPEKPSK